MKKSTTPQTLKTLVFSADDKGGVSKSTSTAFLIDAIRQYGYSVASYDGDAVNKTLSKIDKSATRIDAGDEASLDQTLSSIAEMEEDLAFIDTPGRSGKFISSYFEDRGVDFFKDTGVRIIVALTLVENSDILDGLKSWIQSCAGKIDFILLGSGRDSKEGKFDINSLKVGPKLLEMAEGRLITIPALGTVRYSHFTETKGLPSDFMIGGRIQKEKNFHAIQAQQWKVYLASIMRSAEPHLPWLAGKDYPIAPETIWRGFGPSATPTDTKVSQAAADFLRLAEEQ
jgi:hypothetical protein